jgi:hypothetical protein
MDVKRASRKARGVSRPAPPPSDPPLQAAAATPQASERTGKSRWKHDLHRAFARIRLDLAPSLVHVWEIMWDHLPSTNAPFPLSHGTIAREGCTDRTAAARATAELERLGLVVCIRRGRIGSTEPNLWRFPESLPSVPKRTRRPPPKRAPA